MRDFFQYGIPYNSLIIQAIVGILILLVLSISKSPSKKRNTLYKRLKYIDLIYLSIVIILLIIKIILEFI